MGIVAGGSIALSFSVETNADRESAAYNTGFENATDLANRCVYVMFSDPDAYDPAAHFQIVAEEGPPFYSAIVWITDNLTDCIRNIGGIHATR